MFYLKTINLIMKNACKIIILVHYFAALALVADEKANDSLWSEIKWSDVKSTVGKMTQGVSDMFAAETDRTAELIEAIEKFCPEFIEIRNEQKSAPVDAFISKDKSDYEEDAQDILEDIKNMLFDDKILDYTKKIKTLEEDIKLKKIEISGVKKDIINAKKVNNFRKVANLEEKIKRINEEDIAELDDGIKLIKEKISEKFQKMGTALSAKQIEHLCSRIDGDEILKAMTMIEVFKQVLERTTDYMAEVNDDLETMKQYYSICVLLFESNVYAKQLYIDRVNNEWLPKLDQIHTSMSLLIGETKEKIKSDEKYADSYRVNLETNKMGMKAIEIYRKELLSHREKVQKAKDEAVKQKDYAWNTYETASLGLDLIKLVKKANNAFTDVMSIEMPELIPINKELQNSYDDITAQLRGN